MFPMEIDMFMTVLCLASVQFKSTSALDLSNQNLTAVPGPPRGSGAVNHLNIARNDIQTLNATSFIGYDDVMELDLTDNGLQYILDGTFINMYQLKKLHMSGNSIRQLPSVFGPSDQTLELWHMWASISDNSILAYPYFATFVKLDVLNIGGLFNLRPLKGEMLPPRLTDITLNHGSMDEFPNLSPNTPIMKHFSIHNNYIKTIPQASIAWLSELVSFNAASNIITNFPSFVNSSLLEELYLSDNKIAATPRENIEGLTSLRFFSLEKNLLSRMTNISYLTSLETFRIGQNQITQLPEDIFQGLSNLKMLSCEYNQISVLPDIVALLPSLQEFNVQGNLLLTLPDYYSHSSPLTFHIQENPLVCNLSLCWLRMLQWTNPSSPLILDSPTCGEPPLVSDTLVARVHPTGMECYNGMFVSYEYTKSSF